MSDPERTGSVPGACSADRPAADMADGPQRAIGEALRGVFDPCCKERGISVLDMGLVDDVRVDGRHVNITLVLTSGWCPFAPDLVSTVREQVERSPEIDSANVEVSWESAWHPGRLSEEARAKLQWLPRPADVADRESFVRAVRERMAYIKRTRRQAQEVS